MKNLQFIYLLLIVLVTGCASIVGDGIQMIPISSSPEGAQVSITDENGINVFSGTTPTTVALKKGDGYFDGNDFILKIQKDGYEDRVVELKTHVNGWYLLGNLVFGGLIGYLIVDPLTGAMWSVDPETVSEELNQDRVAGNEKGTLHVILLDEVPAEFRNKLVRLN